MHQELDVVRLKRSVENIPAGAVGTVMMTAPANSSLYLVEFSDPREEEILLVSVHEDDLEDPS